MTTPMFMDEDAPPGEQFVCDWFVIGGRYSGLLANLGKRSTLSPTLMDMLHNPRSIYQDEGSADDAILLDHQLYLKLLAEYEGKAVGRRMEQLAFLDLDGERVSPEFVGKKWLVVVDYHS